MQHASVGQKMFQWKEQRNGTETQNCLLFKNLLQLLDNKLSFYDMICYFPILRLQPNIHSDRNDVFLDSKICL